MNGKQSQSLYVFIWDCPKFSYQIRAVAGDIETAKQRARACYPEEWHDMLSTSPQIMQLRDLGQFNFSLWEHDEDAEDKDGG